MSVFLKQVVFLSDMDIFSHFADFVTVSVHQLIEDGQVTPRQAVNTQKLVVELPREESHGDLACNAAMVLAKQVSMAPRDLAGLLADKLAAHEDIAAVDIAGPGFLNITLKPGVWPAELNAILSAGSVYGQSDIGKELQEQFGYSSVKIQPVPLAYIPTQTGQVAFEPERVRAAVLFKLDLT